MTHVQTKPAFEKHSLICSPSSLPVAKVEPEAKYRFLITPDKTEEQVLHDKLFMAPVVSLSVVQCSSEEADNYYLEEETDRVLALFEGCESPTVLLSSGWILALGCWNLQLAVVAKVKQ